VAWLFGLTKKYLLEWYMPFLSFPFNLIHCCCKKIMCIDFTPFPLFLFMLEGNEIVGYL
jgi:hypothetical protein